MHLELILTSRFLLGEGTHLVNNGLPFLPIFLLLLWLAVVQIVDNGF